MLPGVESVGEATDVVLVSAVPFATLAATLRIRVKVAVAVEASVAMLQLAALGVQVNDGPDDCASETNVAPAASASLSVTLCASLGPLLMTVMV